MAAVAISARRDISAILQAWRGSVDEFVINEMRQIQGPASPAIEVASRVGLAIDNARNTWWFDGDLTRVEGEASPLIQYQLRDLRGMVVDLQSKRIEGLQSRVDVFMKLFKLPPWRPKLTSVTPPYVKNGDQLSFTGACQYAAAYAKKGGYSLTASESIKFTHVQAFPDQLTIGIRDLHQLDNKCRFVRVSLDLLYKGWSWWPYTAGYTIWVGVQPLSEQ